MVFGVVRNVTEITSISGYRLCTVAFVVSDVRSLVDVIIILLIYFWYIVSS